jgi:hypothetical protein
MDWVNGLGGKSFPLSKYVIYTKMMTICSSLLSIEASISYLYKDDGLVDKTWKLPSHSIIH